MDDLRTAGLLDLTTDIVVAYLSKNSIDAARIPSLIASVHAALDRVDQGAPEEPAVPDETKSRAEVRKSIGATHLISFLDGRPYKTLKRHLAVNGLRPDDYRQRFGLPADYPMTHPSYSAHRSELAKSMGLGAGGRKPKATPPAKGGRRKAG